MKVEVEIGGRTVTDEDRLSPVTYVPKHADGNVGHPDCEQGVLMYINKKGMAGVLYCKSRKVQMTDPSDLVWG